MHYLKKALSLFIVNLINEVTDYCQKDKKLLLLLLTKELLESHSLMMFTNAYLNEFRFQILTYQRCFFPIYNM